MTTFVPCESRMYDGEDGVTFGCLRNADDGHADDKGPAHENGGRHWSALRSINDSVRCPSLISAETPGFTWRCVEDDGHYPASIHMKTGRPPKGWTDEMSLNPPAVKPVRDPHRQDRIMDAAEDLTTIWRGLGPMGRRNVNEHVGRDLYKALHNLAIEVEERVPLSEEPDEDDGTVNGAPGVTGFARPVDVGGEWAGEPDEVLVDPEARRMEALNQARKAWPVIANSAQEQAHQIIIIAQAFEQYLTDGGAALVTGRRSLDELADDLEDLLGPESKLKLQQVIMAAVEWVDRAHLANPSGPENWRNWADDHDITLINAVLRYRGMPPIESEKP